MYVYSMFHDGISRSEVLSLIIKLLTIIKSPKKASIKETSAVIYLAAKVKRRRPVKY